MTLSSRQKLLLGLAAALLLIVVLVTICSKSPKTVSKDEFYYEEQTYYAPPAGHQPMYDAYGQPITHYYPGMVAYRSPSLLEQVIMTRLMLDAFSPVDMETNRRLNRLERDRQYNEYRENPREFKKNYGDPKAKRDPKRRATAVAAKTKKTNKSTGVKNKRTVKKPDPKDTKKSTVTKPGSKPPAKKSTIQKPKPKPQRRSSSSRRRR